MCSVCENKTCRYGHTDPVGQGPHESQPNPIPNVSNNKKCCNYIIIIIIIIKCNWVVTRWQWLFYMHTKYEIGYY